MHYLPSKGMSFAVEQIGFSVKVVNAKIHQRYSFYH